ncbi:MAG: radical SAM protein [Pseudomonadota bacterium]
MNPSFILINPWIYDFAAYDLWAKPLGLLYLAGYLRSCGVTVHFLDCLDVHHPEMKKVPSLVQPVRRSYGTGKFWKEKIPRPPALPDVNRSYSRYGITEHLFVRELQKIKDPSAILVTSLMTYWYPGVREVIALAKKHLPRVPVILGGIYARLCREHALKWSGADYVHSEALPQGLESLFMIMHRLDIPVPKKRSANSPLPYPAFDLLTMMDYVCLLTSVGCPYRCKYCASPFLNPKFMRRDPMEVLDEILHWQRRYGIKDFAFYDDALLIEPYDHIMVLLEEVVKRKLDIRFHTPNALHIREITADLANILYRSGFRTIRLGLETSDMKMHSDLGGKISPGEFEKAILNLTEAGFVKKEIGAYILMGLPGQKVDSIMDTIRFVGRVGVTPYLAEYSPLPHTPMWKDALLTSPYDLASEPLFHNNSLLPCWDEDQKQKLAQIKRLVRQIRSDL